MRIGNYIKIGTFIIIGIFVFPYVLCAQNGYYFFSDSDKVAIRNSANTLWGSVIVESMKEKVKEQKSAWMKTKRNKANVIKKTYLLILPSNVAIYRR